MVEVVSWHRAGQLVALRNDLPDSVMAHARRFAEMWEVAAPEHGMVYTVRDVVLDPAGTVCFRLVEIVNPATAYDDVYGEPMFTAAAFRPVNKPSIESLRALLTPPPEELRRIEEIVVEEVGL